MIDKEKYITLSLELHLFFDRIMKEHSLFLEAGFTSKDKKLAKEAEHFKTCFEKLLLEAVKLSKSQIRKSILDSGELFTAYTLEAEKKTEYYTGIDINSKITSMENNLNCKTSDSINDKLIKHIKNLNFKTIELLDRLIDFKMRILNDVLCCNLFTFNYSSLLEHLIEEGKLYRSSIKALESNTAMNKQNIRESELFGNEIMMEHSLFIRGLLDPNETELIKTSNRFANEFKELIQKDHDAVDMTMDNLTSETLMKTIKLRDFKKSGAEGILNCKIRSLILPLLSDHVIREANYYIRVLNDCREV